jgi:hypothetical protein
MTTTAKPDPHDARTTLVTVSLPMCDKCEDKRCPRTVKVQMRCAKNQKPK